MTASEQSVIIGVFENRQAVIQAIEALLKAGFAEQQIGFAARSNGKNETIVQGSASSLRHAITRGIVGGILGAADMLLLPVTGPADASSILGTALPVTEEAIDHLPYPGSHEQAAPQRPDAAMLQPDTQERNETRTSAARSSDPQADERTGIIAGGIVGGAIGAVVALLIPDIGLAIAGGVLAAILGGTAIGGMAGGFLGAFTEMGVSREKAHYYEQEIKAGSTLLTVHTSDRQQEVINLLQQHGAHDVQSH